MPDDLDQFEIRTREEEERETEPLVVPPMPAARGRSLFMLSLAIVAVLSLGAIAGLLLILRPWRAVGPVASSPSTASTTPRPRASASVAVPPLDGSDDFVRRIAAGLSSHPEFARWLGRSSLVRTLTVVVSNIADGETPRPHLPFLAPTQRFRAVGRKGKTVADPASYRGYDVFADAVASIDAGAAAAAYRASEPLFDAAYRELGHPEGFRSGLDRATQQMLAVPVPPLDAELLPHAIGFRWADPAFEALTPAQKQLLRLGPRNVRLVQGKLRELQRSLQAAPSGPGPAAEAPPAPLG